MEIRLTPVLAGVLAVVLVLWHACGQRSAVQVHELEQGRARLLADVESLKQLEAQVRQERAVAEQMIAAQGARIDSQTVTITTLTRRDSMHRIELDSLSAQLAMELPVRLRPLLAQVVAGYELRLARKDSIIEAKDTIIHALALDTFFLRQQLVRSDSARAGFHQAMHDALGQSEAWRRRAQRNVFEQVRDALPWMAGVYVVARLTGPK